MKKRLLSMLLVLVMILTMLPMTAYAAEPAPEQPAEHTHTDAYGGVDNGPNGICDVDGCTACMHETNEDTHSQECTHASQCVCWNEEHKHVDTTGAADGGPNGVCDKNGCTAYVHADTNSDGRCDREKCGLPDRCMHVAGDVYCTEENCDHDNDCACGGKYTEELPGEGNEGGEGSVGGEGAAEVVAPTSLAGLNLKVSVVCDHPEHDETGLYDVENNTWKAEMICLGDDETGKEYYCSIVVDADYYVSKYDVEALGVHTNSTKEIPSFELKWEEGKWEPVSNILVLHADCVPDKPAFDYYVIDAYSGKHGDISSEGLNFVAPGADKTFYFYPDKGYEVSAVYVDGYLVNYHGICIDHRWNCKGCEDCWWIDWSQWYDCDGYWCDHDDCWHEYYYCDDYWCDHDDCWYDCYGYDWYDWQEGITFYDVEDDHTLRVEFAPIVKDCASAYYWDLDTNAWYHEATDYVISKGLMLGVGNKSFDPYGSTTRGELVTMLYRLAGEPNVKGTSAFTDVADGKWYSDAVIWAANKGIITGYGDGTFGVDDVVTREQTVAILYRYAKWIGMDVSDLASLLKFVDAEDVSEYAEKPFGWAVEEDVIEGKPVSGWKLKLDPQGITERVEMAAMLMRFAEYVD